MGFADARLDREVILEQASRARNRRQWRRAIALYRQALATSPNSVEIHERLAPLLAGTRQDFDAWNSYRAVAHAALREGREDRAIAVFREAAHTLPHEIQAWQGLARLLVRQGESDAAIEVLLEGSRQFRSQFQRPQAIHLLRRARAIDPWHFETVLELALHLGRAEQQVEAGMLLEGLAERCQDRQLRRVRAAALSVAPGPRALVRWVSSWRGRKQRVLELEAGEPAPPAKRERPVAPVITIAPEPALDPALEHDAPPARRSARVVPPDEDAEQDRSTAVF
jgi:tetratricopeptide (TPR) repeat protein